MIRTANLPIDRRELYLWAITAFCTCFHEARRKVFNMLQCIAGISSDGERSFGANNFIQQSKTKPACKINHIKPGRGKLRNQSMILWTNQYVVYIAANDMSTAWVDTRQCSTKARPECFKNACMAFHPPNSNVSPRQKSTCQTKK